MGSMFKSGVARTTGLFAAALATLLTLNACGKKEEKPVPPPPVAAVPAGPDKREAIAAMLRGHPNSIQICVDELRENAFFLDYGPLLKAGEEPDGKYHGWLFIEKVEFYKTSNNTWFITLQEDKKYAQVYPDVTGLTCKVH